MLRLRPHIRQLVYMALHPPPPEIDMKEADLSRPELASPSKSLSRQHTSSLTPSLAAREAALNLLSAFALTNTPGSLLRALPSYPQPSEVHHLDVRPDAGEDDGDSHIARQALRIKNAKDCWNLLKEGFVQYKPYAAASPKKRGTRLRRDDDDLLAAFENMNAKTPDLVGEQAWPVLGWLLSYSQAPYSPLLLSQIPPPRNETGLRWDVEAPLDVAFFALQQPDLRRRTMGVRLLTLLINLASTKYVDFPIFLNAVSSRVFALPTSGIASLLSALPPSRAVLRFKLALYKNYLTDFGVNSNSSDSKPVVQGSSKPRPVAPRRRQQGPSTDEGSSKKIASQEAPAASIARKFPQLTPSEVLELIKKPPAADSSLDALNLRIKAELVISYWMLQKQKTDNVDAEWQDMIKDGRLENAIEIAWTSNPDDPTMLSVKHLLSTISGS